MYTQTRQITNFFHRKREFLYLSLVWLLGIFFGVVFSVFAGDVCLIANTAASLRPNLGLLYAVNVFPVVVLAFAFAVQAYGLVYITVFLYGLFHSFCGMCTVFSFGSGGWLVRSLLMFSATCVSLLMWWLIFSCFSRSCRHTRHICSFMLLAGLITLFDYFVVSPFLMGVI